MSIIIPFEILIITHIIMHIVMHIIIQYYLNFVFLSRSRLVQHQPGSFAVHRMLRSSPEARVPHLQGSIPWPGRVAAEPPGRHGRARQRRRQLDLGIRNTQSPEFPEAGTELVSGGEGEVHLGQVQSERVPCPAACRPLRVRKSRRRHLSVRLRTNH